MKRILLVSILAFACGGREHPSDPPVPLAGAWSCGPPGFESDPYAFDTGRSWHLEMRNVVGDGSASGSFRCTQVTLTQYADLDGSWGEGTIRLWRVNVTTGRSRIDVDQVGSYVPGASTFTYAQTAGSAAICHRSQFQ